jgi:anaerobic ribonucleoside-triphosphate reductase activating protein
LTNTITLFLIELHRDSLKTTVKMATCKAFYQERAVQMHINIHAIIPTTTVNGPGQRFGIWVQGCHHHCKGCFNPETHNPEDGTLISIENLYQQITEHTTIEGISVSGGEPFEQAPALTKLLQMIHHNTNLTCLVYTGYTFEEITSQKEFSELLPYIDILIAGPFIEEQKIHQPLLSSSNQTMHLLNNRYNLEDIHTEDVEIIIADDGTITITGHQNFTV